MRKQGTLFKVSGLGEPRNERQDYAIKFVSDRYGEEAHRALVDVFPGETVAPQIYGVDSEAIANHNVAVMQHLPELPFLTLFYYSARNKKSRIKDISARLEEIVSKLHDLGFVHGDIRPLNVLIETAKDAPYNDLVALIDFDWAGRAGVVRYPLSLNRNIKWPAGVAPGALITKEHDIDMLKQTLAYLARENKKREHDASQLPDPKKQKSEMTE